MSDKSKFIILVGPSGVGKSIVTRRINNILQDSRPKSLKSYTLRPPRPNEQTGDEDEDNSTHYHFYDPNENNENKFTGNFFWSNYEEWSKNQENNTDDDVAIDIKYRHLALDALVKKINITVITMILFRTNI